MKYVNVDKIFIDICRRHIFRTNLERPSFTVTRKYDPRISAVRGRLVEAHVATRFLFQKC